MTSTQVRDVKTTTTIKTSGSGHGLQGLKHQTSQEERNWSSNGSVRHGVYEPFPPAPIAYHTISVDPYDRYYEPVIYEPQNFNPAEDAKQLRKAMKGMGTDENAIIEILTRRSNRQRQIIAEEYRKINKDRDLIKDLKSELSGTLEDVILGLMLPPEVFDARTLNKAVAGLGTDEATLIEVIGSRTPAELNAIKKAYKFEFKNDLTKDVEGDTSGFFRQLLLAKLQNSDSRHSRDSAGNYTIFPKQAYHEAQALWETGPKQWQKEPAFFVPIFTQRSDEHLRQVFEDYKTISHVGIERDIEKELPSGDARDLLQAFVQVSKNRPAYFADRLAAHLDGKTATRIIVSRAEKDLGSIKKEFKIRHGGKKYKDLNDALAHGFSGDAKKVLLGVVGPPLA